MEPSYSYETPILLLTFNRPVHTSKVFEAIKKQKPKYLFVFQDAPRSDNDADKDKCSAVQAIFKEPLDWDCKLRTNFASDNLGCGKGPVTGISWFFENVEQGIIIEDDAVPSADFFQFAAELLERYKNNVDIRAIGSMKIDTEIYGNASYYFSMMNRTLCAWATWKRAWLDFDYYMKDVTIKDIKKAFVKYKLTWKEKYYWEGIFLEIQKDRLRDTSWDLQFLFSIWLNQGMGICPNVNLSTNIGFDFEATHTTNSDNPAANLLVENLSHIIHPTKLKINRKSDRKFVKMYYQPYEYGFQGFKRLPFRINVTLKRLLKYEGSWLK